MSTSSDCPAISSSLHPLITQNLVDTTKYYCPFQDRGFCRDKSRCNFSHERNNSIKVPLDYCHFYLANRCLYGVECKFQHIEPLESLISATNSSSSGAASSTSGFNSLNDSNASSDYANQSSAFNKPSTSSRFNELNVDPSVNGCNNNDHQITSPIQTTANPSTNHRAYHQNNNNLAVDGQSSQQQRLQSLQFAHHSQYWYHPTIPSSSTNTCPFLGGLDKSSSSYYHNGIPNHYSSDDQPDHPDSDGHRYMQMQQDIYDQNQNFHNPYNEFVPPRLSSSLPSLISAINSNNQYHQGYQNHDVNTTNELVNIYDMVKLAPQTEPNLHQDKELIDGAYGLGRLEDGHHISNEAWGPVATFCRRHSIGHINMISDEHLLLSCDLCGRRCLQPADHDQQRLHRDECLRELEQEMELSFAIQRSKDKVCGICMDVVVEKKPVTSSRFGILEKCSHIFCLDCIRKWRGTKQFENRTIRACPECRTCSDFVVPSKYWVEDKDDKEKLIHDYKENLKSKACKYFDEGRGECPFAGACFYKHAYPDGRIAKFNKPKPSRRYHSRNFSLAAARLIVWNIIRRPNRRGAGDDDDDDDDEDDDDIINIITDEDVDDTDVDEAPIDGDDADEIERIISVNEVIEDGRDDDDDDDVDDIDDEDDADHDHLDLDEFEMPTFEEYDTEDFDYAPVRFQYRLP